MHNCGLKKIRTIFLPSIKAFRTIAALSLLEGFLKLANFQIHLKMCGKNLKKDHTITTQILWIIIKEERLNNSR